ncbi:MAG: hypothetical protein JWL75_212 [Parcubacteria group bacterium]|nr:hypothetical protein [Parcubacteria group bacterium]
MRTAFAVLGVGGDHGSLFLRSVNRRLAAATCRECQSKSGQNNLSHGKPPGLCSGAPHMEQPEGIIQVYTPLPMFEVSRTVRSARDFYEWDSAMSRKLCGQKPVGVAPRRILVELDQPVVLGGERV